MLPSRIELERRLGVLKGAILYVEEQCRDLSRDSTDFLAWTRRELKFAETLLDHYDLIEAPVASPMPSKVAA